jgi:hypothetical protein
MKKLIEIDLVATEAHGKLAIEIGSMATTHVKKLLMNRFGGHESMQKS